MTQPIIFNSSHVSIYTSTNTFQSFPKYIAFELFLQQNDKELHTKLVKPKPTYKKTYQCKDNVRKQTGKKCENDIVKFYNDNIKPIKDTKVRKSKVYNITDDGNTNIDIEIKAEVDAVNIDNEHIEIKKRINSLSQSIRYYEKEQLLLYMDIFDLPSITLFEYIDDENYKTHTLERGPVDEIISKLCNFVEQYNTFKNDSTLISKYAKGDCKVREKIIKDIIESSKDDTDSFLTSLIESW